ncbi:hypothetical protein I5M27_15210 [Adhaeribacter sp. BT258]|uniref:Uncharacterized protein n=1 Tax=Adhaeribacter terrigena TaxID=2793070 RepID=A0ABS1C6X5_9BACT|nr:hypothetical protein [Adhaeribacter terrigena]MBK0404345.1 hypothetical protein [Adhaeribacter terrigena]
MENKTNKPNQAQSSAQNAASASNKSNAFNMEALTGMLGNGQIPEKIKQYSDMAIKKVNSLSTTQKVIGGALLVLGAGYLSKRSKMNFSGIAGRLKR